MSLKLGKDADLTVEPSVLEFPKFQGSLSEEIHKDYRQLTSRLRRLRSRLGKLLASTFSHRSMDHELSMDTSGVVQFVEADLPEALEDSIQSSEQMNPVESSGSRVTAQATSSHDQENSATPLSPILTPTTSRDPGSPAMDGTNVRVRARTGSTSTLHMDVVIAQPTDSQGAVIESSFTASARRSVDDYEPTRSTSSTSDVADSPRNESDTRFRNSSSRDSTQPASVRRARVSCQQHPDYANVCAPRVIVLEISGFSVPGHISSKQSKCDVDR